jgi:hypothetical protein
MSTLLTTIQDDLKQAMRDRNTLKVSTLRMITAAVKQFQIDQQTTAVDSDVIGILTKMTKQRQESAKAFIDGKRPELAEKEEAEIALLKPYLPEALSDEEITQAIETAMTESGAAAMSDMGKVMGILTPQLKGRADMGKVSQQVRALLMA